jgi:hypothetical protein
MSENDMQDPRSPKSPTEKHSKILTDIFELLQKICQYNTVGYMKIHNEIIDDIAMGKNLHDIFGKLKSYA